ncbi:hypothetical protein PPTG_24180 [Phytophthora nicotianae INRA-310]|uniref:Uncharacterized protein n=1 Tax=Phytophthora nicotianae (strain INRA-310) TaxID=761204 RepID=W2PLA6_PHYN3|nr:hypothetical protein PPTG_24180 [Phytophthora nicotianae INRA-310]ETN00800.1 hypothetical protein PPTG_24180 [Phytophthora nicotianae INRA-310]
MSAMASGPVARKVSTALLLVTVRIASGSIELRPLTQRIICGPFSATIARAALVLLPLANEPSAKRTRNAISPPAPAMTLMYPASRAVTSSVSEHPSQLISGSNVWYVYCL